MHLGGRKKLHNYSYTFFNMPKHVSKVAQTASQHSAYSGISGLDTGFQTDFFAKTLPKSYLESNLCKILILGYWKLYIVVLNQISFDKNAFMWVKKIHTFS